VDAVEELTKELSKSKLSIAVWLNDKLVFEEITNVVPSYANAAVHEIVEKFFTIEENYTWE
jgi:hypothetical protein